MTSEISSSRKPLRLWPGIVLAAIVIAAIAPFMTQLLGINAMLVAVGGSLLILVWWLLFSRARCTSASAPSC